MSSNNTLNMNDPGAKEPMSGCGISAMGCGITLVVLLIAGGLTAWWVSNNIRSLGTDVAVSAMKDGLNELEIPEDQLQRIHNRIDSIGQQYKDGDLEMDQLVIVFEQLGESPLLSAGASLFFKRVYLQKSGLSDEEKEAGETTIQRFARGIIDQSIPKGTINEVLDLISDSDGKGSREFRQKLTDEDLRAFLSAARQAADDAEVSAEVPEINYADEFEKAINDAMKEAGATSKP